MADNLIFPIGFDIESAVRSAEVEGTRAVKRLEDLFSRQPLILKAESKGFAELEQDIDTLKARLKEIQTQWNQMPTKAKFDLDADGNIKKLTAESKELWDELLRITTALQGVGQTITQFAKESSKALAEETRFAEQMRQAEINRYNETARAKNKEMADDEKRYQKWLANKEKEVQKEQEAAQRKQNAQERATNAARKAQRDEAIEAYKINTALKAREDVLSNLATKLQILQQRIQSQQVGTDAWNKTALEIRRVNEELQKANQQMQDFQQKAFQGLSDSLTKGKVDALTRYREQLRQIEADFNRLNQTGGAFNSTGGLTSAANDILRQRQAIIKQINQMLTTAADVQIQREKEINRIYEQRKAKADAIAAKRKAEQAVIQGNIAKMKEERRILNQQESSVAAITAKLQIQQQRLQSAKFGSDTFNKAVKEVERLTKKLELSNSEIRKLTGQTTSAADKQAAAHAKVGNAMKTQTTYIERLIKRMAVYASLGALGGFLRNVREVTAQFELQRVSLGAIIQDQNRANMLFSEIKQFALQSPISIMDLTKYTKQVAAYRIETDKLFDTTKRLADVSVGLGVDMGRLVLAYGQVKAASYLRAAEIRQFTEAGIPMLELLADKFTQLEGKVVSTEQVMDKVSKRMVSFGMVEDLFKDMTSAGGMFYDMQTKQSETLFGMWAKLGDAASVMYDQIGNTESVNRGMKNTISLLETLMRNWKATAATIATMGTGVGAIFLPQLAKKRGSALQDVALAKEQQAKAALETANKKLRLAENELSMAKSGLTKTSIAEAQAERDAAAATQLKADADYKAAAAANANTQKQKKVALGFKAIGKSLVTGLGIGVVITLVTTLIFKLYEAWTASGRLRDALAEIDAKAVQTSSASVQNFRSLANAVLEAEDGSRKQIAALEELQRTYSNMIPIQDLTVEKLRAQTDGYASLTDAIKEYIAQQTLQEKMSTIYEEYGKGVEDARKDLLKYIQSGIKVNGRNIGADQGRRIIANLRKGIEEDGKGIKDAIRDAFSAESIIFSDEQIERFSKASHKLGNYGKQLILMTREINNVKEETKDSLGSLGRYADMWTNTTQAMEDFSTTTKKGTFQYSREKLDSDVRYLSSYIKGLFSAENLKYDDTEFEHIIENMAENGEEVSVLFWDKINKAAEKGSAQLKNALKKARDAYYAAVPSDQVINLVNAKIIQFTDEANANMNSMRRFWLAEGADISEVAKNVKSDLEGLIDKQKQWEKVNAEADQFGGYGGYSNEEMEGLSNEIQAVQMLLDFLQQLVTMKGNGGRGSDPRLSILQEMASSLKNINKEYDELAKKQGAGKAYANTFRIYQKTFENMQELSKKYNFGLPEFDVPTTATELKRYLDMVRQVMDSLPKSDKSVLDLQVDIDKIDIDDLQKQLEKKLKSLSDKIAQSKVVKEFFDMILDQTGDVDVAINMTTSVYGTSGGELQDEMANYIRSLFGDVSVDTAIEVGTSNVDYTELETILNKNVDIIAEKNAEVIRKLIEDGRKANAAQVQQWFKDIKAAEDFADKRVKLARETAKRIAEVEAQARLQGMGEAEKDVLISGYKQREDKEAAKLEYEAFKDMPMYVQLFDDLDNASTMMLRNMQSMLQGLKGKWGEALEPTQLKEMQSRLNAISEQLAKRNPFKAIGEGIGKIRSLNKEYGSLKTQETKLATETAKLLDSKDDLTAALQAEAAARKAYDKAVRENGANSQEAQNAKKSLTIATAWVEQMRKNVKLTEEQVKLIQEIIDKYKEANDEVDDGFNGISQYVAKVKEAQDAVKNAVEEWSALGDDELWNTIFDGLDYLSTSATQGGDAVAAYFQGDYFTMVTKGISSVANLIAGIGKLFYGARVARANKEIERQQKILDQLEYSYNRLENAIDKTFGTAYLQAYRQQLQNLQAQQNAYLKQAEAERSKGKKADQDKIKDYEDAARDAADAIADMHGTLAEKFLGSDLASAARDFAQAWIDAYKEFGNTADAMSEKFQDMIQNMIVESLLGSVMEKALKPAFDMIDNMKDSDFMNQGFWESLTETAAKAAQNADAGAYTMMSFLEQAGITMRDLGSDLTGISRDVATASEESINGLAAAINTQNFYISQQLTEVRLIREAVVNGGDNGAMFTDLMAMQNEHLSQLPVIAANTAATVERCERAALACEDMASQLRRVIRPKQEGNANYVLNTKVLM